MAIPCTLPAPSPSSFASFSDLDTLVHYCNSCVIGSSLPSMYVPVCSCLYVPVKSPVCDTCVKKERVRVSSAGWECYQIVREHFGSRLFSFFCEMTSAIKFWIAKLVCPSADICSVLCSDKCNYTTLNQWNLFNVIVGPPQAKTSNLHISCLH